MMHLTINSFPLHCLLSSYVVYYTLLLPFHQVLKLWKIKVRVWKGKYPNCDNRKKNYVCHWRPQLVWQCLRSIWYLKYLEK